MATWNGLLVGAAATLLAATAAAAPHARPREAAPATQLVDRVVARWHAPETGGIARPQFVFERELAFETRLEALAEADTESTQTYRDRHVRAALDRHIAETLLASLAITPAPSEREMTARIAAARLVLEQRVHGHAALVDAAEREGIGPDEVDAIIRRQARASLYLDRMVAPMLEASDAELRELWRSGATPFKDKPFDAVKPALGRWLVAHRVAKAIDTYYQNARSRVVIAIARHPK